MNFLTRKVFFDRKFAVSVIKFSTQGKSGTVDDKDVRHHSQFSEDWWNSTDGQFKALHSFNPLRVKFVRDGLINTGHKPTSSSRPLEGLKILDVGCGGGILSEPLARLGANVVGLDASHELIAIAKEHMKLDKSLATNLNYVRNVIEDWKEENRGKFDAVVASEILEHVIDPDLFLKSCTEVLKPNGSLFITTINKTPLSFLGAILAVEYVFKILPLGTHDWNKFISPEETRRILNKFDCKTVLIHGIMYNPLRNDWFWISSTSINYGLHAVKQSES